MAKGKLGVDSSVPVNTEIEGKSLVQLATTVFNATPVFWGRYFTSVATAGDVEYRHLKENQILRQNNIRVLPIARQTKHVNSSQAQGIADAQANVKDLITTFGQDYLAAQGGTFFLFLDVEGTPSLSAAYFKGWVQTLESASFDLSDGPVQILPGVYGNHDDEPTWEAVATCADQDIVCQGAWVARWVHHACHDMDDWDDQMVLPKTELPCKVLVWQYSDECYGGNGFDCNQTNPSIDVDQELLSQLVLPPDIAGGV